MEKETIKDLADDLVVKPTELKLTADKYGKHARKIWKNLTKNLSSQDNEALNILPHLIFCFIATVLHRNL